MVFQHGHQRAADGEAGAVEGVHEAVFAVFVFETRLHAAGLEVFAVGAAGNFAVGVLRGHPHFEVVGFRRAEAHVAGAEGDDAVGKFQQLQDFFGVADHFFQRGVGRFGAHDLHHFHFVELMLADEAARVFAMRAGFAAETGRVGGEFERQIGRGQDAFAHGVGEGNFGGGDEVLRGFAFVAATGNVEQVFAEFGQLAGAEEGGVADDVGGVALGVAVPLRVGVEHELGEGAVQAGDFAFHQAEPRAGEGGGGFKIEAEFFAQIDVVFHGKVKHARRADAAHFHVLRFVAPHGHALVRQVGDGGEPRVQLGLHGFQIGGGLLQIRLDAGDGGHGGFGFFVFALPFEHADFLRFAVAFGLQFFGFHLQQLALVFQRVKAHGVKTEAARGQAGGCGGGVVAEELDVEHGASLFGKQNGVHCKRF